jgi:hypothetical protein
VGECVSIKNILIYCYEVEMNMYMIVSFVLFYYFIFFGLIRYHAYVFSIFQDKIINCIFLSYFLEISWKLQHYIV